jgi:hypothetical protein
VRAVAAVGRKPAAEPEIGVPRSTVSGYLETTRTPPVEAANVSEPEQLATGQTY